MLNVVTYLWNTGTGSYRPDDVFILRRMVERNLTIPHRFTVLTDDVDLFKFTDMEAREIENIGIDEKNTHSKLNLFKLEPPVFGLDLDCIVLDCLDGLLANDNLVVWHDPRGVYHCNSSMILHRGGHEYLFDKRSQMAKGDGQWISYMEGPSIKTWSQSDGVGRPGFGLKEDFKIAFFPGSKKPLHPQVQKECPWLNEYIEKYDMDPNGWIGDFR